MSKQWKWASSGGILTSSDQDWRSTEPNNFGGNEDCVEMVQTTSTSQGRLKREGHWNDLHCSNKRYPICHIPCDAGH